MIKIKERGNTIIAECEIASGYGPSRHDAVDDLVVSLCEILRTETGRLASKAAKLVPEAKRMAGRYRNEVFS